MTESESDETVDAALYVKARRVVCRWTGLRGAVRGNIRQLDETLGEDLDTLRLALGIDLDDRTTHEPSVDPCDCGSTVLRDVTVCANCGRWQ